MARIMKKLTALSRCSFCYREEMLKPYGLKGKDASFLVELCACPGLSQEQLARRICTNKSNVTREVAVLEEAGFLTRCCQPEDKRAMMLFPTQKTLDLLPRIREILCSWSDYMTQDLTPQERETLDILLAKMMVRADEWMEER